MDIVRRRLDTIGAYESPTPQRRDQFHAGLPPVPPTFPHPCPAQ